MKINLLFVTFLLISPGPAVAFLPFSQPPSIETVVQKLQVTAELDAQQVRAVLTRYQQLGNELVRINSIDRGITTGERRNLVKAAFEIQRTASLEYLHPNEYRRWMRVARQALPKSVYGLHVPQHNYGDTSWDLPEAFGQKFYDSNLGR